MVYKSHDINGFDHLERRIKTDCRNRRKRLLVINWVAIFSLIVGC
jgi:hypothetical protein